MDKLDAVDVLECCQELPRICADTVQRERLVVVVLEVIIERAAETLKHHAYVPFILEPSDTTTRCTN